MQDQWFLDLDGVRSGPYRTIEVLNLISEGEVLPHHLIGTTLKSKEWKTILDWKLEIAKKNQPAPTEAKSAPITIELEKPVKPSPVAESASTPLPSSSTVSPLSPSAPAVTEAESADAMAEMFDTIQHTRQKREQKSQQEHAASQPIIEPESTISNSTGKFILISVVITVLGFVLGQYFQKQNLNLPSTSSDGVGSAISKSSAPITEPKTQILDRSNERITIRSQVPMNSPPPPPPTPARSALPNQAPAERPRDRAPEREQNNQMLDDLKKELSELKALKEEFRNNNENNNELPDNNGPNGGPDAPSGGANPAGPMNPMESGENFAPNGEQNGAPAPGSAPAGEDTHY